MDSGTRSALARVLVVAALAVGLSAGLGTAPAAAAPGSIAQAQAAADALEAEYTPERVRALVANGGRAEG